MGAVAEAPQERPPPHWPIAAATSRRDGKGGQRKVYVDIEPVSAFYRGEEYHQDFLDKQMSTSAI